MKRIPVVLDTDIGSDIDDTWALAMLLKSPEFQPKLITTATGDTFYRAKLTARLLQIAERTNIPIGVGVPQKARDETQAKWIEDFDLSTYRGAIAEDGIELLVRTIMDSPEPVTLIAIAPATNIAAALEREPRIAPRTHFVGMFGSIHKHKENRAGAIAEYNVVTDIAAAQRTFAAPWLSFKLTPLDTCGRIRLTGERYARLLRSREELLQAVFANYRCWAEMTRKFDPAEGSSILFDTVAVYMAFTTEHLVMRRMGVGVTKEGKTVEDSYIRPIDVAIDWKNLDSFEEFLTTRLLGKICD